MTITAETRPPSATNGDAATIADTRGDTRRLAVGLATPFGAGGRGGMDRLSDLIVDKANAGEMVGVRVWRLTSRGQLGHAWGALVFAAAASRLLVACLFGRIDVLHLNVAVKGSFHRKYLLAQIARLFAVPYVVHIHSGRFGTFWAEASGQVQSRIDAFMRNGARIIVLGEAYRDLFAGRLPDVLHKVVTLANATPARAMCTARAPGEPVRITFLGRLGALKGTPALIEALGKLEHRPGWVATLAGDGDLAASRARLSALGLSQRVAVPGWLQSDDVDTLLADTDIFILPSFSEGLPMAIIEAFAAGIAVIATPVNAVVDVVQHERNGLFVTPGDAAGIAAALLRLIDDPDLRRRLGAAGRQDHQVLYEETPYLTRLAGIWRTARA